jgi:hypothetical protein
MPKCKNCKEKFDPIRFNQKYCLNDECIKEWIKITKEQAWKKKKKEIQNKLISLQELIKMAQIIFNKWIRIRDKGLKCISCKKIPLKENAGHYFNAHLHYNLRFNEDNVHLQCEYCNTYLSGNLINYRENLIERIGIERFNILESEAKKERKFTKEDVQNIIDQYKRKIKESEKK